MSHLRSKFRVEAVLLALLAFMGCSRRPCEPTATFVIRDKVLFGCMDGRVFSKNSEGLIVLDSAREVEEPVTYISVLDGVLFFARGGKLVSQDFVISLKGGEVYGANRRGDSLFLAMEDGGYNSCRLTPIISCSHSSVTGSSGEMVGIASMKESMVYVYSDRLLYSDTTEWSMLPGVQALGAAMVSGDSLIVYGVGGWCGVSVGHSIDCHKINGSVTQFVGQNSMGGLFVLRDKGVLFVGRDSGQKAITDIRFVTSASGARLTWMSKDAGFDSLSF